MNANNQYVEMQNNSVGIKKYVQEKKIVLISHFEQNSEVMYSVCILLLPNFFINECKIGIRLMRVNKIN